MKLLGTCLSDDGERIVSEERDMKRLIVDKSNVQTGCHKYIWIIRVSGAGTRRPKRNLQNLFLS